MRFVGNCPIKGDCPYYEKHKNDKGGCPLKENNCPYFAEHMKDKNEYDTVTTKDHGCILKDKNCKFYQDFKEGKPVNVDWTTAKCPLHDSCPYYKKLKSQEHSLEHCPLTGNCPHFKGKGKHSYSGHPERCPHLAKKASKCPHDSSECPYMSEDHSSCPMQDKCPYYQKLKDADLSELDFEQNDCPLKEKCGYYQKLKDDPKLLQNCPIHGDKAKGCPHLAKQKNAKCPHDHKNCPYKGGEGCPLESKCPYYEKIKSGDIGGLDLDESKCPLKDECPYYQKFLNDPTAGCPATGKHGGGCPRFVIYINKNKITRKTTIVEPDVENVVGPDESHDEL